MKKLYFFLFVSLFIIQQTLLAQGVTKPPVQYFVLTYEVVVHEINFLTEQIDSTPIALLNDLAFDQLQDIGDGYVMIKPIQKVRKKKQRGEKIKPSFKIAELGKYYVVKKSKLDNNTEPFTPKTWEFKAGIVNIPVKFYFPDDDNALDFSSKSVSLGTSVGAAHQVSNSRQNLWINYLLGVKFTMVTPTPDDFISFDSSVDATNTLSAFSISLGVGLDFEGIEVGLFLGKDFLPGDAAQQWKHNGDTWFSIGVGTSLTQKKEKLTNY